MSGDERHRRRKSSRRPKTHASDSKAEVRKDATSVSPDPETSDRPATLEDLRKARLNYLTTPIAERQKKMKYEYVKTVKAKESSRVDKAKEGSSVPKSRSKTKSSGRRSRSKPAETAEIPQEEEDSQYVYGPPRRREHVARTPDARIPTDEGRKERSRTRSRSTRVGSSTKRRHSEPVIRQESTPEVQDNPRPQLRKSTTTLPERPRPSAQRGSVPTIPETEVATVFTASSSAKRPASVFSNFFATKPQPSQRKVSCLTCGDDVSATKTAKLPCTHRMCHSCLRRLFKLSVTDPAHMPPKCCTDEAISLKHVDRLFDQEFKKLYNRKLKEYGTKNKIYCPAQGCGEWIQPKHMMVDKGRKIGRCPACRTLVCGICSQKMHKTRDCPKDPAVKEFTETAKKAGWKKCYSCSAMVELKEGCNHMTCRCTAEFCMMCGLKWKSCDCPWFSYDQLDQVGDPIRFQQEMDRRREQENQDEAMARRMEALQLGDDRPALVEWLNLGNLVGNQGARGFFNGLFGDNTQRATAMPGAWDDDLQHLQRTPPQNRRQQQRMFDPAAMDQEQAEFAGPDGIPVLRHRAYRRRVPPPATMPAPMPGFFENRQLTEEEREQERLIRAWATGGHEI